MNFFQLIYAYIKKNIKTAQETEDSDERKKQWIKIVFGIVLALGYGGLHVPPNVIVSEVIYALGILFITLYVVFRALKYFKSFGRASESIEIPCPRLPKIAKIRKIRKSDFPRHKIIPFLIRNLFI